MKKMTAREKQLKFRENVKYTIGCTLLVLSPVIMCLHWLIIGY